MRHPLIVDGRNLLDPDAVRALGFEYEGIGPPDSATDVLPEAARARAGDERLMEALLLGGRQGGAAGRGGAGTAEAARAGRRVSRSRRTRSRGSSNAA